MTMFKTWLTVSEALKYSDSALDDFPLCHRIIRNVEHRLNKETDFNHQFQNAKDTLRTTMVEKRRSTLERNASRILRKAATVRFNAPECAERRRRRIEDHDFRVSGASSESVMLANNTQNRSCINSATIDTGNVLPASYFEGRQLLFKMSYCNATVATSASQKIQKSFPLQMGDSFWLLDQFLLHNFPNGGTLNCADPSIFPDVGSIWPKLITFCGRGQLSQHPYAGFWMAVAMRASDGTYGLMQNVVSLEAALKILRTSIDKKSYVKLTAEGRQARYTTFLIDVFCQERPTASTTLIRNAQAKSTEHGPCHFESHAENIDMSLQVQNLDVQEALDPLGVNPLETSTGSTEAKPPNFKSHAENIDMSLQVQNLDDQESLDSLEIDPTETITTIDFRQLSRLGRAAQDTVDAQLKRQDNATHNHLHRAPNVAKGEFRSIQVWCRKRKSDITKRIENACRFEVSSDKYVAWLHVCQQCCFVTSKNKYPQQHFIPVDSRIPFVLFHTMCDRERRRLRAVKEAK